MKDLLENLIKKSNDYVEKFLKDTHITWPITCLSRTRLKTWLKVAYEQGILDCIRENTKWYNLEDIPEEHLVDLNQNIVYYEGKIVNLKIWLKSNPSNVYYTVGYIAKNKYGDYIPIALDNCLCEDSNRTGVWRYIPE